MSEETQEELLLDQKLDESTLEGEPLKIYYVPVRLVAQLEGNPKRHDIGSIVTAIQTYGFRDPPAWDLNVNAVVEGNGRSQALQMMEKQGYPIPRGIMKHKDTGFWCMPILFGVDAESQSVARRYAIDHNNLTMMGGDFTLFDMEKMWDHDAYLDFLGKIAQDGIMPISVSDDDFEIMMKGGFEFEDMDDTTDDKIDAVNDLDDDEEPTIKIIVRQGYPDDIADAIKEMVETNADWEIEITVP